MPDSDTTIQVAVIVPLPNAIEQAVIVPLPNAPVRSADDEWIVLPTDPPKVMRRSDYDRMMENQHDR